LANVKCVASTSSEVRFHKDWHKDNLKSSRIFSKVVLLSYPSTLSPFSFLLERKNSAAHKMSKLNCSVSACSKQDLRLDERSSICRNKKIITVKK